MRSVVEKAKPRYGMYINCFNMHWSTLTLKLEDFSQDFIRMQIKLHNISLNLYDKLNRIRCIFAMIFLSAIFAIISISQKHIAKSTDIVFYRFTLEPF